MRDYLLALCVVAVAMLGLNLYQVTTDLAALRTENSALRLAAEVTPTIPQKQMVSQPKPNKDTLTPAVVTEYLRHVGRVQYTTDEMIKFIQVRNSSVDGKDAERIAHAIVNASKEFNIPTAVLLSLMAVESSFIVDAKSNKGAVGLMQINHAVWLKKNASDALPALGIAHTRTDLYDIETNVRAGAYILAQYRDLGMSNSQADPMGYALARYLGGTKNDHPVKVRKVVKQFADAHTTAYRVS